MRWGALVIAALGACGTLQSATDSDGGAESPDASPPPEEASAPEASTPEAGLDAEAGRDAEAGVVTTIDLTPSKDSYVEDDSVDTNFGTSAQLRVKGNSGGTLDRNTWLSFDIHAFASVTSAHLRLMVVSLDTGNTNPIPIMIDYAPSASDSWGESTLTWNNSPPGGPNVAQKTVVDADLGTWIDVDVTAAVAADTDGVATFFLTSPQLTGRGLTYSSREGATKPVLHLTGVAR